MTRNLPEAVLEPPKILYVIMRIQYCYDEYAMTNIFWGSGIAPGMFLFIHTQTLLRQADFYYASTSSSWTKVKNMNFFLSKICSFDDSLE